MRDRDAGLTKLNQCVEAGERLYGSTAPEGREDIRQELRNLKTNWDSLYDELSSVQRRLEVSLVQWTSFDESYNQVENWLREMETLLEGQVPLRSTLEEKKTQLQTFKVCFNDRLLLQPFKVCFNDRLLLHAFKVRINGSVLLHATFKVRINGRLLLQAFKVRINGRLLLQALKVRINPLAVGRK